MSYRKNRYVVLVIDALVMLIGWYFTRSVFVLGFLFVVSFLVWLRINQKAEIEGEVSEVVSCSEEDPIGGDKIHFKLRAEEKKYEVLLREVDKNTRIVAQNIRPGVYIKGVIFKETDDGRKEPVEIFKLEFSEALGFLDQVVREIKRDRRVGDQYHQ